MSERKIVVPEGMLHEAMRAWGQSYEYDPQIVILSNIVKAVLLHLAENPIVPTEEQFEALSDWASRHGDFMIRNACVEWQRRMFLAPEPEVPEAIKDLQRIHIASFRDQDELDFHVNKLTLEAYRRGQKAATR